MIDLGIITSPRNYLGNSLDSLFDVWFESDGIAYRTVNIFAEPGIVGFKHMDDCVIRTNERTLGCVRNWLNAATWLYENTKSPFVMVCEDDIQWTNESAGSVINLLKVLSGDIWVPIIQEKMPLNKIGFISPYCSLLNKPMKIGWQEGHYSKSGLCGALSVIMPRASLGYLVEQSDQFLRLSNSLHLDYAIGSIFENKINLTHNPTLVYHMGDESTFAGNNLLHNKHDDSRKPAV